MANREHVDILVSGVDTWNQWRKDHPDIVPDLSGAELEAVFLPGVNLSMARLEDSNFDGCNFEGGTLRGATAVRASFIQSKLCEVDLTHTLLGKSNLRVADLRRAKLTETVLSGADFRAVNLSMATIERVSAWPLIRIDSSALELSGKLPKDFLSQCEVVSEARHYS